MQVQRYHPEHDAQPYWQTYHVPYSYDMSVLEGLQYVKDRLDGTLTFRWSCRMAICGTCGCMIDNQPALACHSFLRDFAPGPLRIAPLAHLPIVRDLVIDPSDFLEKMGRVQAYLQPQEARTPADGPYRQRPAAMAAYYDHAQCINCLLCYAACPQYDRDRSFIGPAALALAQRYNLDDRDGGRHARQPLLNSEEGVWGCTLVGSCSQVCPQGVDPARAINRNKLPSALDWLGSKLFRRRG
nr:2Fe-2S iron-sulfur cluster-binding protein [Halorhodospira abdelmalekii]